MAKIRRQLTLFIDQGDAQIIEMIRAEFNPLQHQLIKSHVTLCREDEIEPLEAVIKNLSALDCGPVTIHFGPAVRFSDGLGVLIPAAGENIQFEQLRTLTLAGLKKNHNRQEPHITLMHPRNSSCNDSIFEKIAASDLPKKLMFNKISLIEQENDTAWKVLKEFSLNDK
jgi:2'-5' RNA ligase